VLLPVDIFMNIFMFKFSIHEFYNCLLFYFIVHYIKKIYNLLICSQSIFESCIKYVMFNLIYYVHVSTTIHKDPVLEIP